MMELLKDIEDRDETIATLRARVETLKAALRPFAADMLQPKHDRLDDAWRMPGDWYTEITVGDLRRAKKAYEADQ